MLEFYHRMSTIQSCSPHPNSNGSGECKLYSDHERNRNCCTVIISPVAIYFSVVIGNCGVIYDEIMMKL